MTRLTGSSSYFIEAPGPHSEVAEWFRALPQPPEETPTEFGVALHFRTFGPLAYDNAGKIDVSHSPVATIVFPAVRRGILWTVGEVNFLATLSFPENKSLRGVASSFSRWLRSHQRVHERRPSANCPFAYYLEGSSRNWGDIYALRSGLEHLKSGGYVVSHKDKELAIDRVCRSLRLRGIDCGGSAQ